MWKRIICWTDRNWNLLFKRKKCIKITFWNLLFQYNDMVTDANQNYYRCLEKQWFILQEPKV